MLAARAWPGNVRELENAVARMLALSAEGGAIGLAALETFAREESPSSDDVASKREGKGGDFRTRVDALERTLIVEALEAVRGNRAEAARRLGLSRVTLLDRIKRRGIAS